MSALSEHYAGKECPGDPIEESVPAPRASMFAAWHPIHGFGPVNEIAIREQYDHAKADVKLLSHTGDNLWTAVAVELKIAGTPATLPPVAHRWRWKGVRDNNPWRYGHGPYPGSLTTADVETLYTTTPVSRS